MAQAYQQGRGDGSAEPPPEAIDRPPLALRRHTDRCFFAIEEVVEEADGGIRGYLVEGHLIDKDDVAELRFAPPPDCDVNRP